MDAKDVILPSEPPEPRKPRGFAAMSDETKRRICSLGGKAAHAKGTAHQWDSEKAAAAGRKGGATTQAKRAAKKQEAARQVGETSKIGELRVTKNQQVTSGPEDFYSNIPDGT